MKNLRNLKKLLFVCSAPVALTFTTAQAQTTFNGGTGSDFDSAWDNGLVSSSNPGIVNTSASGLARATASFGGGWTINHTAGDLEFSGGWNVNGGGVGGTYNLSGGSISVTGTTPVAKQDTGNLVVNNIDFNMSGGAVSCSLTFKINNGSMNFQAGSGSLTSAAWNSNSSTGTMNFVSGWTGSINIATEDADSWKTMLATTLAGSTFDGVDITEANFDDFFVVTGSTLTAVPEPGTYALIGGILAFAYVMLRRRRL